ncbi:MAG: oligosaccharide flippase family protein [Solirubrobacterales bacterium]|nr:oligosaccharide flippase family protein [Solirubrobacterales bacterium]
MSFTAVKSDGEAGASDAPPREAEGGTAKPPRLASVISKLTAANFALVAAGIVTAPLQARALGPTGRGELAAITAPLSLAPIMLTLGLSMYTFRAVATGRRPGTVVGTIGAVYLFLGAVAIGIGPLVGHLVGGSHHVVSRWVFIGFAILPLAFVNQVITDTCVGENRWGPVIAYRLCSPIVLIVGVVVLFLIGHLTVASAAILSIGGGTLPIVFLVPFARRYRPLRFDRQVVREGVPFGLRAWAAGIGQLVNVRFDQLLMTRLVNPAELGLYAIAVTASGVLVNPFATALTSGTMPRFATGSTDLIEKVVRTVLLGVLVVSIGVAVASPVVVPLVFGSSFKGAVPMIWILLGAGIPLTASAVLSSAVTSTGHPGWAALAEIAAICITIPGLILLLPSMGGEGAALVSLVAYSTSFSVLAFASRRKLGVSLRGLLVLRPSDGRLLVEQLGRVFGPKLAKLRRRLPGGRSRGPEGGPQ